jgi:hypothetical protein
MQHEKDVTRIRELERQIGAMKEGTRG